MRPHRASDKATHSQLRLHNRQLVLRAVYSGLADNRAALAQETGLAKPTVSELIGELIDEGFLIEQGRGQSTSGGGKRPRLLQFVPAARHVIGVAINEETVQAALAILDGQIIARHYADLNGAQGEDAVQIVLEAINGLVAQLDAPLLSIGVGVAGLVDGETGIVRYAPHLGWRHVDLAHILHQHYHVSVYVANSTALAAMAEFVYGPTDSVKSFAVVRVGSGVGVGLVINGTIYYGGGEIGHLRVADHSHQAVSPEETGRLETFLGWPYVRQRAYALRRAYPGSLLPGEDESLTYLHIRYAATNGDPAALALQAELSDSLAQIFAWIIGLLRPDHITLAGPLANLGPALLEQTIARTRLLVLPDLVEHVTFSLSEALHLVAVGAIAQALHFELGLV